MLQIKPKGQQAKATEGDKRKPATGMGKERHGQRWKQMALDHRHKQRVALEHQTEKGFPEAGTI
jgi:hypothetical protein